jgi:hypothetical protein
VSDTLPSAAVPTVGTTATLLAEPPAAASCSATAAATCACTAATTAASAPPGGSLKESVAVTGALTRSVKVIATVPAAAAEATTEVAKAEVTAEAAAVDRSEIVAASYSDGGGNVRLLGGPTGIDVREPCALRLTLALAQSVSDGAAERLAEGLEDAVNVSCAEAVDDREAGVDCVATALSRKRSLALARCDVPKVAVGGAEAVAVNEPDAQPEDDAVACLEPVTVAQPEADAVSG